LLTIALTTGPLAGCASLSGTGGTGGSGGVGGTDGSPASVISVGCTNNFTSGTSILDWELAVSPEKIESGRPFFPTLDGIAVFSEGFLDLAQLFISGGVREVNLVDISATVHVRSGATGDDVVLVSKSIPYKCSVGKSACDPANDVLDDPPKPRGLRGNTDCEPVGDANPCGRFVPLPTSSDCSPDGVCDDLDKTGTASQCSLNQFCIIGDLRFELERAPGEYTADSSGNVLFGWADESTGATVLQDGGRNDGTWVLPEAVFERPVGPVGLRVTVGTEVVALECAMGVDSQGSLGVNSEDMLSSPTPDSALISFPIQSP